jgi:hypothetical protein
MQYWQLHENSGCYEIMAHVIVFDDDQTVVKWCGKVKSLVVHKNLDEFKSISVTGDRVLYYSYYSFKCV